MIKESIDLKRYDLYQFLSMRLTLINIDKNPNPHQQPFEKHTNYRLEDQKRLWIIQMIREIKSFIEQLPEHEIKRQNALLVSVSNHYNQDIREIFLGRNGSSSSNFLFNHDLFFDFYSELMRMKERYRFELLQLFEKSFAEGRKSKAMETVIFRT